ncbi:hypothetical protein OO185_02465 [Prosthecochloris sp. SCSIO W1102]|uniref:hypothetical protein n=1 Tax=Prosthecochloris sp. SCSIO W1102 TaxID=2992243 RepID=UPI00223D70D3|nr:hypothetical protein [Prosthecochloris sp. SCSIO W1102]UZJ39984.1 hypothetical protein OO185_02465 [Prosthecochloris sp. SCSIO W1102]
MGTTTIEPGTISFGGVTLNIKAIASGWLRILQDSVPADHYACLQYGMLPADLFSGLMDAVKMKLAKIQLESQGIIEPPLPKILLAKESLSAQVVQEVEHSLAVAIVAEATEAGICRV